MYYTIFDKIIELKCCGAIWQQRCS